MLKQINKKNDPTHQINYYYSTAASLLKASAFQYTKALKRKTIIHMIDDEKNRRKNISQLKLSKLVEVRSNKNDSLSKLIQSESIRDLQQKRLQNSLIKNQCQKSVILSKSLYLEKKKNNASQIKVMIKKNHKKFEKLKNLSLCQAIKSSRTLYLKEKQAIKTRWLQLQKLRSDIINTKRNEVHELISRKQDIDKKLLKTRSSLKNNLKNLRQ